MLKLLKSIKTWFIVLFLYIVGKIDDYVPFSYMKKVTLTVFKGPESPVRKLRERVKELRKWFSLKYVNIVKSVQALYKKPYKVHFPRGQPDGKSSYLTRHNGLKRAEIPWQGTPCPYPQFEELKSLKQVA